MSATKLDHLAQKAAATLMLLAPFALLFSMGVLIFRGLESGYFAIAGALLFTGTGVSLASRIVRLLVSRVPLLTKAASMLRHAFNVGACNVLFFGCVIIIVPSDLPHEATGTLISLFLLSALACAVVCLTSLFLTVLVLIWTGRTVFTRDTAQLVMDIMRQAK